MKVYTTLMAYFKEILTRLRALRKEKKFSQDFVACKLGIDRTTYARKEQGLIPITTLEWLRIADCMDEDPAYFFQSSGSTFIKRLLAIDERLLLKIYRNLSIEEKQNVLSMILLFLRVSKDGRERKTLKDSDIAGL